MPTDPHTTDVHRFDVHGVDVHGVDVQGVEEVPGLEALPRSGGDLVDPLRLATLLSGLDVAALDTATQVLDVAVAWDRLTAWTQAQHLAAVAEFARRPEDPAADPVAARAQRAPRGEPGREHAGDEVAAALGLSIRGGEGRVWTALPLCGLLPATWAALAAGRIDWPRATAMVEEASGCDRSVLAELQARLLRAGRRGSPGEFRRARADTYVRTGPLDPDTSWIDGHLPAEDAIAIRLVLDAAATALRGPTQTRSMDQLRAAALAAPFWAALATGHLANPDGPIPLAISHGQAPALDLDQHPAHTRPDPAAAVDVELRGYGPITPDLASALTARSTAAHHPLVRIHTHRPDTTAHTAQAWPIEPGYQPSPALRQHIIDRDHTCRHPGRTVRAPRCDLDHTTPWPAGPTTAANLGLLCRRHHQRKQTTGVHLTQPTPGHFRWRMPTGRQYEIGPPD